MKTESTWSPFQSPEVKEICSHLTPSEKEALIKDARERGRKIFKWIVIPLLLTFFSFIYSLEIGFLVLALLGLYVLIVVIPLLKAMRRRSIEFLCNTEWAQHRGYTSESLRLNIFPWSK